MRRPPVGMSIVKIDLDASTAVLTSAASVFAGEMTMHDVEAGAPDFVV